MSAQKEIIVVQNDKLYPLNFTLTDEQDFALDLSGATLQLNVQRPGASAIKFTGNMDIDNDPATGKCSYTVQDGNFDETGSYYAEIVVTFPNSQVLTFPNIIIKALPRLARE